MGRLPRDRLSRRDDVFIQSRDLKPLDRYFPELRAALLAGLPDGSVLDGEIVIATPRGLDFDALQMRLHPAATRAARLAKETPSSFVAFDALAAGGKDLRGLAQSERRLRLEALLARPKPSIHLTPMTARSRAGDRVAVAVRGRGAGRRHGQAREEGTYQPGKRAMIKVKHARTADCVVAGFSLAQGGERRARRIAAARVVRRRAAAASRRRDLGLHDGDAQAARDRAGAAARRALEDHPWREWADAGEMTRMPGGQSRWSAGKDLSWEPLRIERVCEVKYDHMQGPRFRHAAIFQRWRPDKRPIDCGYDQLEVTTPYELEKVFGAKG